MAQAAVAAAIGLFFSKRHLPSILHPGHRGRAVGLAVASRTGSHAVWVAALAARAPSCCSGARFMTARYVGGTLLAISPPPC